MRLCFSHLGQTLRFTSRSFFQMICRQLSHFTQRPSVRTFFSPEVSSSPDWRLNQAIEVLKLSNLVIGKFQIQLPNYPITQSVFDSSLRHDALFVGVLYLAHFSHGIGEIDNCRMCVPSRQDNVRSEERRVGKECRS